MRDVNSIIDDIKELKEAYLKHGFETDAVLLQELREELREAAVTLK